MSGVDIRYLVSTPTSQGPVFAPCPAHNDKGRANLAVYPDHAHCFRCGFHETAEAFCRRLGTQQETLAQLPQRDVDSLASLRRVETVSRSQVRIWHNNLVSGARQDRKSWLYARGLNDETIEKYLLGHTGSYFSIPISQSDVWAYKLRADPCFTRDDAPRYLNSRGLSGHFRPNRGGRPTVICEGEFDALLLAQYGVDAVTVFSGAGAVAELAEVIPRGRCYVCLDNDDAGDEAWQRLSSKYSNLKRITWEQEINGRWANDISDVLTSYPMIQRGRILKEMMSGYSNAV